MTKDLSNLDNCKRAIEDTESDIAKHQRILKALNDRDLTINDTSLDKVIAIEREILRHLLDLDKHLEAQLVTYKKSK